MIRTFLAVEIPSAERGRLAALERQFMGHKSMLKWVPADLLHLTVRFLGGVPETRIGEVEDAAARAAADLEPFSLFLSGLGAFPNERLPRVIWVGLRPDAGLESLTRLFRRTEDELARRGFAREERDFSPHITLARARDDVSSADRRSVGETLTRVRTRADVSGPFPITSLVVMKSELSRTGPLYTALARAALRSRT